jgi:hypothetical protein
VFYIKDNGPGIAKKKRKPKMLDKSFTGRVLQVWFVDKTIMEAGIMVVHVKQTCEKIHIYCSSGII